MPNAFQFIDKTTNEAEKFSVIDDKLREFLKVPADPERYYRGWYDAFGELAAAGRTFPQMKMVYVDSDEELHRMLDWFDEHYRTTSWYSPK
jgi:hypothetical protein